MRLQIATTTKSEWYDCCLFPKFQSFVMFMNLLIASLIIVLHLKHIEFLWDVPIFFLFVRVYVPACPYVIHLLQNN